jgi:predicted oxidoreductase
MWRLLEWERSPADLARFLSDCIQLGLTAFDHADIYGEYRCEQAFGLALKELAPARESIQLISKCGICLVSEQRPTHRIQHYNTSRKHLLRSVENSLRNLGTEYLDLLLIHRPDPLLQASAVADTFHELQSQGKVRHFGVSNFLPHQFQLLQAKMDFPLVTNQIEYSPLAMKHQADGTIDLCQQLGIRPMAWSPFAGGALFTAATERAVRVREALKAVGNELGGASLDQVALAWILAHPAGFLPVLGTGKLPRVRSAIHAFQLSLTRQQWFSIWEASAGEPVP